MRRGRLDSRRACKLGLEEEPRGGELLSAHSVGTLGAIIKKSGFDCAKTGRGLLVHGDCASVLQCIPEECIHGIVTDPPYGVKEFDADQLLKMKEGNGGIWRIPPSFDGHKRAPLPRFTALNGRDRERLASFFAVWGSQALQVLRPGAHLFIAANTHLSVLVFSSLAEAGFEFRGEVIRLVMTLRGGSRPKNAESEFPDVMSLPRGAFEPWGLLRKPIPPGMTVAECLRVHGTGGLRRKPDGAQFLDVIGVGRTSPKEKGLAPHPALKPQELLRQLVHAALPLGEGILLDPFMGSGSTVAAADALGLPCIGVERDREYFELAVKAVPQLASLDVGSANGPLALDL